MPNLLKGWHQEFIFVRGGDVEYMRVFRTEAIESFFIFKLRGDALAKVVKFCSRLRNRITRDSFMSNETLYNMGCK